METVDSLVFYDSQCSFCTDTIAMLRRRIKTQEQIAFDDLRSFKAREVLRQHDIRFVSLNTIYVIRKGKVLTKSNAILELLTLTTWKYLAAPLLIIPQTQLDKVYEFIAKHRYKISSGLLVSRLRHLRTRQSLNSRH